MKRRLFSLFLTATAMGILILDSKSAVLSAAEGVDLCIRTVIPSLFPFFVLSIYLTGILGSKSILLSGFLGGYPVGAQTAAESWRTGNMTRETANRMLLFCSQAGPSFLFGMVAWQFPNSGYAWLLWVIQLLSAWSVAHLFQVEKQRTISVSHSVTLSDAMKHAARAMASVCGWVVIFRVVIGFARRCGLWLLPQWSQVLISGILELTSGCLMLSEVSSLPLRILLAAVMLNFGGICVVMQTAAVTDGLDIRYYILGKLLQTVFSLLYSLCFLGYFAALIPIFLIFLLKKRSNMRKNSSIPDPVGV